MSSLFDFFEGESTQQKEDFPISAHRNTVYDSTTRRNPKISSKTEREVVERMQRLGVGMMSARVGARTRWIQVRRSGGMGVKKDFRIEVRRV